VSFRLLSYNIKFGGVGREKLIAAVIKYCEPDVVVLQEATRPDVVEKLASACGMKAWAALHGNSLAFLSRVDVRSYCWHHVPLAKRSYLEVAVGQSNARIFGVHLSAIHSNVTERRRAYELKALLKGIAQYQHGFHIATGDFNTLAPGAVLDLRRLPPRLRAIVWITGRKIHWTTVQLMLDRGYTDAYRALHADLEGFTFPTWDPHVRLDYAFVPTEFAKRVQACNIMSDAPGVRDASDHYPLLTELTEI
jgi:endonuclease/exonuclease/phosphatase family metal-dependent hydrolase